MHKLNNRYLKAGIIGLVIFLITRTAIAIANSYVGGIPFPNILALIAGGVAAYFALKSIRY